MLLFKLLIPILSFGFGDNKLVQEPGSPKEPTHVGGQGSHEGSGSTSSLVAGSDKDPAPPTPISKPEPEPKSEPDQSDKVKIGEEEYTPEEAAELISKGTDYTKKTQELASNRKELENELAVARSISDYMNNPSNQEQAQRILSIVQGRDMPDKGNQPEPDEDGDDPYLSKIKQQAKKIERLENTLNKDRSEREVSAEKQRINSTLDKIRNDNPNLEEFDVQNILSQGYLTGKPLEDIATNYVKVISERENKIKKNYVNGKIQDGSKTYTKEGGSEPPKPPVTPAKIGDGSAKRRFAETFKKLNSGG